MSVPRPTRAFLLAAGFGTRMRPLTWDLPKPMMPLWGRPIIGRWLERVRSWGVNDVIVNVHHAPCELRAYLADPQWDDLTIHLSHEPTIRGTGGALTQARELLGDDPFWLINTDIVGTVDPIRLVKAYHADPQSIAAAWVSDQAGPRTVDVRDGRIVCYRSSQPGTAGTATFCGVQLLSSDILAHLPGTGFATIVQGYEEAMSQGRHVAAVLDPAACWADLGTPETYLAAHRLLLQRHQAGVQGEEVSSDEMLAAVADLKARGVRATGMIAIAPDARVAAGASLHDTIVWPGARVGPRTRARNAIIGASAHIDRPVTGPYTRVPAQEERIAAAVTALGWPLTDAHMQPLSKRGSGRSFVRLVCGRQAVIWIGDDGARPENARYALLANRLKACHVPVPDVLASDARAHWLVMQDLGDASLNDRVQNVTMEWQRELYKRVMETVVRLHGISSEERESFQRELEPAFGPELYAYERELFLERFLRWKGGVDPALRQVVAQELEGIEARLAQSPVALVHRDLQSTNIYLKGRQAVLIDFQGLRLGPPAYDLASLLCDPYVALGARQRECLKRDYLRRGGPACAVEWYQPAAVQRLCQAMGAYVRLSEDHGLKAFESHIPRAMAILKEHTANRLPGLTRVLEQA